MITRLIAKHCHPAANLAASHLDDNKNNQIGKDPNISLPQSIYKMNVGSLTRNAIKTHYDRVYYIQLVAYIKVHVT